MVTTQLLGRDYFISGDEIDEFTLLEIIGGGGEGGVWSAWDKENERIVALKFFGLDETTRTIDKRREELLGLAKMEHPNIRKVYSTGDGPGYMYFVMAYYPSGSLADLLHGTPLPIGTALKTAAQITQALDYIHTNMVIHRDLKPTNILIDHKMHAFLTDFGIARTLSDSTMALHTGQGTPAYSSPEQHSKAFIDNKTDIYSFGVMLFEIFTGDPPWHGLTSLAIRQMEGEGEIPDPREYNPDLPTGLHQVLKELTAYRPEDRPDSIVDAFEMVLEVWGPAALGGEWMGEDTLSLEVVLSKVTPVTRTEEDARSEASDILSRTMATWRQVGGKFRMGLTAFIFLDKVYSRSASLARLNPGQISFIAMFSIIHGRNAAFWWDKVTDLKLKMAISENILEREVGNAVLNLLNLVLNDPEQFSGVSQVNDELLSLVVEQISDVQTPEVVQKALVLTEILSNSPGDWVEEGFSDEHDRQLAELALSNELYALDAAELIGKVRSAKAVEVILGGIFELDNDAGMQALAVIRQRAGGLPKDVPVSLRMQTWMQIFQEQVLTDWGVLGWLFLISWLSAGLAFFFHVFVTTRLPSYLIASRLLNSIGSGLLFGPLVGLGIMVSRWVSRCLVVMSKFGRSIVGVIAGGFLVNLGFLLFHILFLSAPPSGFLILLGSLIFPIGFGLTEGFSLRKGWQAAAGTLTAFVGLLIPNIFARILEVSPMLYYESGEPLKSVLIMFGFSCILGVVPQLFREPKPTKLL